MDNKKPFRVGKKSSTVATATNEKVSVPAQAETNQEHITEPRYRLSVDIALSTFKKIKQLAASDHKHLYLVVNEILLAHVTSTND